MHFPEEKRPTSYNFPPNGCTLPHLCSEGIQKKLFWAITLSPLRFETVNYVIRVISLNGDSMSSGLQVLEFPRRSVEGRAEF